MEIHPIPKAWAIADDPEPVTPIIHTKGGYGDYLTAYYAALTDDNNVSACLYNNVLLTNESNKNLRQRAFYQSVLAGNSLAVPLAKLEKNDAIAALILANDAIINGKWQDALSYFQQMPPDSFSHITYPLLQAWSLYATGQKNKAFALLNRGARNTPLGALYLLHAGVMQSLDKNDKEAGHLFNQAYTHFSGADLFLTEAYGNWLLRHNRTGKAEAMIDSLVKNLPALTVSKIDLRHNLQQLPVQNPQQAVAHVYLAMASLIQQELSSQPYDENNERQKLGNKVALHTQKIFLQFALKLDPNLSAAKMMLSGVLTQQKHPNLAKEVLLPIPTNDPLKTVMQLRLAQLDILLNANDQANKTLKTLLVIYPNSPDILQVLGDAYFDHHDYKEATITYDKVIDLNKQNLTPNDWSLFFSQAIAYEKLKQWSKSEEYLKQALALAPNEPILLNYLGYSWVVRKQNLQEAQKILQKAVDIAPDEGAIRDSLGWAMLMNKHLPDAIKQLELASETIPQDPELNYHLGVAYWQAGRHQEAINQWNIALTCSPTPEDAKLIHNALQKAKAEQKK